MLMKWPHAGRVFLENILVAGVYFVSGILALDKLVVHHVSAAVFWPPSGIALAALLLRGNRCAPGIFVGAFCVNIITAGNFATSLSIATGNTVEPLLAAFLC